MKDTERNPLVDSDVEPTRFPRYATFDVSDGGTVLYDRDCPTAWLQSTRTVELPEVR